MEYIAKKNLRKYLEVPEPEKRTLSVLISSVLDPSNHDIAMGKTEMTPGCQSDYRGHEEGELFYCIKGKGTVLIGEDRHELDEDEAVYVPPFKPHQLLSDRDDVFSVVWILTPPFGGDINILSKIEGM